MPKIQQLNIIFFGTPEFSAIVLQKLIDIGYKPACVVTAPDKPVGRKQELTPTPVKSLIMEHKTWNIKILQPEKLDSEFANKLKPNAYDLFIVAAYGKIIPADILKIPKYGTLNIHPSLLPLYRGPSPIQAVILNGNQKTGVTIMKMDEKMDHGPIVAQRELKIKNQDTFKTLGEKLFDSGAELLIEILPDYIAGKIKPKEQNHKKATYTKIIKKEDGHIDWSKPADYIESQLRAFTPWPGIYTFFNNKRLKILDLNTKTPNIASPGEAMLGKVMKEGDNFLIQTGKGFIVPEKVQLEGKKMQTAQEFLRGYPEIIGSILK